MPRTSSMFLLLLALLLPARALAQNPFLENKGQRTIQSIRIEGNERTKLYVLERELGFEVGDNYESAAVNDAWARLEALPFIAYVEVETEYPAPGQIDILIRVVEEEIFRWSLSLNYSRRLDEAWYGQVKVGTLNARGRAETLDLAVSAWALREAQLRWTNPWILDTWRLGVFAEASIRNHDWVYEPAPDAQNTAARFLAGMQHEFGPGFRASLAARWRTNELSDLPAGIDPGAFGGAVPLDEGSVRVNDTALLLSFGFDNRDSEFYTSRGLDAQVNVQLADMSDGRGTWSTVDLSVRGFVPVPWLKSVGGIIERRLASDPLPWYERSYYGGPMTLRGVPFASERGDEFLRAGVEIRRPIFVVPLRAGRSIGLGVHGFAETGAAWNNGEDISDQRFRESFGLGAHFNLNTFNYRFEWARYRDDNFFVFEDHFTF